MFTKNDEDSFIKVLNFCNENMNNLEEIGLENYKFISKILNENDYLNNFENILLYDF